MWKYYYQHITGKWHIVLNNNQRRCICNLVTLDDKKRARIRDNMSTFPNSPLCEECSVAAKAFRDEFDQK
jgi:hypothetical protein